MNGPSGRIPANGARLRRSVQGLLFCLVGLGLVVGAAAQEAAGDRRVLLLRLDEAIQPITAEYVVEGVERARAQGFDLLVLQINTPGGLDASMRRIIQAFLASPVPVCLWVAPSGARAASAGFFMAMAADFVAMAPATNMGAASPVSVGGGTGETMQKKLIHDAEAYIRSLAAEHGRPQELAAAAVTEGRSFSAEEALANGLADLLAADLQALLAQLDGRSLADGARLELAGAAVQEAPMSWRQRFLSTLASPNVAYLLMLAGIAGLYFEFSTPGAVLPGVLGGICLLLAALAFQWLPISYTGLALIALGVLFFILEVKVTSYGLLTIAGLAAFVLGSLMLVPGPIPEMRLHLAFVLPTALSIVGIAGFLLWLVVRTHRGRVRTGPSGLVGETGVVRSAPAPGRPGRVFVHGELWRARAERRIDAGDTVRVKAVEPGMVLLVEPIEPEKGD